MDEVSLGDLGAFVWPSVKPQGSALCSTGLLAQAAHTGVFPLCPSCTTESL